MNKDNELKVRYYDFLEESKRLDDSIINEEKRKSKDEGIKETKKDIILNMIELGLDLDTISNYIKISVEEINKIINKGKL